MLKLNRTDINGGEHLLPMWLNLRRYSRQPCQHRWWGTHIYIYYNCIYIYTYVYIHTLYTHTYQSLLHLYRFGLRDIGAHRNSLWNLGDFGLWGSNWWCSGGHWVLRKVWHWVRNASTCYYTYQEDGRFFHFHVYFFGKKREISSQKCCCHNRPEKNSCVKKTTISDWKFFWSLGSHHGSLQGPPWWVCNEETKRSKTCRKPWRSRARPSFAEGVRLCRIMLYETHESMNKTRPV